MFPKFPADPKGIKIEEKDFDRMGTPEQWQIFAETKIKRRALRYLDEGIYDIRIKTHFSIWNIAYASIDVSREVYR